MPWEDVDFRADDGVGLAGWVLPREDAKGVVVCCHGRRGNKADVLGISAGSWRAGYEVLLFDFRGNGSSGDGPQSLGWHEQRDVRAAVDLVSERRPNLPVAVVGFSMGAATRVCAPSSSTRRSRRWQMLSRLISRCRGCRGSRSPGRSVQPPVPAVVLSCATANWTHCAPEAGRRWNDRGRCVLAASVSAATQPHMLQSPR